MERDYDLRSLVTAYSSLIQDISLNIRQYCRHIQNSCTFVCQALFEYARFFHPSQYYLILISTVTYIILYGLYFEEPGRDQGIFLLVYHEYWN